MSKMKFLLMTKDGAQEKEINYDQVFAIGYAGRNMEKTMEHIRELEASSEFRPRRKFRRYFSAARIC